MTVKKIASQVWQGARVGLASLMMLQMSLQGRVARLYLENQRQHGCAGESKTSTA